MALPDLIPLEDLFADPVRAGASISPDGTRIAFLAPENNRLNVWIRPVESDDAVCVTHDHNRGIYVYHWTHDSRWLLYQQDGDGDENWHLYRVDLENPESPAVELTPYPGVRVTQVLLPRDLPGKAFVAMNKRRPELIDVYELDIATGKIETLAENPGTVASWQCSRAGDVFGSTIAPDGSAEVLAWDRTAGDLKTIAAFPPAEAPLGYLIELTPDGLGIWLGSNRNTDLTRLVRYDIATGEETVIDSHPDFDMAGLLFGPLIQSRGTDEILGVRYIGDRQVIHCLDPHFAEVYERLTKLSDGDLASISSDESGQRWIVSFTHDREPGLTYYYDHSAGESELLFRPYPHLDPAQLAPMAPVSFTARDGLRIPCYLTLPIGIEPAGLRLVLFIHGGPWFRDTWHYDPGVQFLANRGYAVLQVNFRGSTGYGKAHMTAAIGEFAGKMHDDLIDAVEWAVKQGFADPSRVGIFGGSYGGYATLVAVTFTPDVFAAAVDYCGISDLANFMQTLPVIARPFLAVNWHKYVGDPDDRAQLPGIMARSPITRIDQIRTPLMVVQGANDSRVIQAESDNIVNALRERGVDVEYILKENEGHGFLNPENVIDMYRQMEPFLAKHLGGRCADQFQPASDVS